MATWDADVESHDEFLTREAWEELRRKGDHRFHRPDHNGRPQRVTDMHERLIRHMDDVRRDFPEVEFWSARGVGAFGTKRVAVAVRVRAGTSQKRQREIAAAVKGVRLLSGYSWSPRADGAVWVFDSKESFNNG